MEAAAVIDYDAELRNFKQKLSENDKTLQRVFASYQTDVDLACQQYRNLTTNTNNNVKESAERIHKLRDDIEQLRVGKSQAKQELAKLTQELEKANHTIKNKVQEIDREKEILAECEGEVKQQEQRMAETKQKNQEKLSQVERGVQLFKTYLGLDITCTHRQTMLFKFTQVSRSNPEAEYLLELTIKDDQYQLLNTSPPLPNLMKLQDKLNTTGNFSGCIAHIRQLFQRMDNKRQLEK